MKFILEVNLDAGVVDADRVGELGRILRYWAGNLKHYPLDDGDSQAIYDSDYAPVGAWRMSGG
ncbi:MAG TPA: hypothetical protein VIM10_10485 [Actinopolymorphaceae bacterium]